MISGLSACNEFGQATHVAVGIENSWVQSVSSPGIGRGCAPWSDLSRQDDFLKVHGQVAFP